MIGYSRDELLRGEIYWPEITPEAHWQDDQQRMQQLLATGKLTAFEKELLHKNGRRIPVLVGGILLEDGFDFKWICFVLDLSIRRELEQRLQRAQKMKSLGVMAGGIAHDFNNLLMGILGHAGLALGAMSASHKAHRHIEAVTDAGNRAATLIHQVLAYTGQAYHTLKPINLPGLIMGMRSKLLRTTGAKAEIRFDLAGGLPNVKADGEEIQQVIMNLVINAVEAIGTSGGIIEISARECKLTKNEIEAMPTEAELLPGRYVRIDVADTGCGMPSEVAARAFDPFFTTKFLGRGLGLSAAQGIMRAHHGCIRVESSLHTGTRFQLFFPADLAKEAVVDRPESPEARTEFI